MASSDYNYDVEGQFFPYFILVVSAVITLPLTYSAFKSSKELENTAPRIRSDFKPEDVSIIDAQKKTQKRKERKLKRMLSSGAGWLLIGYMAYLIAVTAHTLPKLWDPYDVLGVSRSADEKQIKSHYRKLSLTQHPDKVRIDASKNQTVESINEHWVEITKAFKALTDEEIRNNYLQYGHPDGKQSFSMGIALPKFLVEDGYGKYTLIFYLALLGIFLPYVAGKWWYGTQKMTKDGILVNSAGVLVREYKDDLTEGDVISTLSGGEEFDLLVKEDESTTSLPDIESKILAEGEISQFAGGLSVVDKRKLLALSAEQRRKALALLWAYLGRVDLGDDASNKQKFAVAAPALQLNSALTLITLPFQNLTPLVSSLHVSQNIIQAIPPGGSPLLQLPYFTDRIVYAIEGTSRSHMTVEQFMSLPAAQRKKLVVAPGLLNEQQYQAAITTALQFPAIKIERTFFRVQGERFVTPNSLTQLIVKFRFVPPGAANIPEATEKELSHVVDEDERVERKRHAPPMAHAPFFARDHSPVWQIFLGDGKMGRIAVPPFAYSTFDQEVVTSDGEPTQNLQTIKMQFGAPPHPGQYTFVMHLVNDSYLGFDVKRTITLTVEDPSKAEEILDEGEISEPDADSLVGQIRALKNEASAPTYDSDESDTEGEVDDDTSETNTDTEDED